jgi:hypothetical protein
MAEEQLAQEVVQEVVQDVVETTSTGTGKLFLIFGGLCIGFTAGYLFAVKQLQTKYERVAESEIAEMRSHYLAKERALDEKKPPLDEVMTDLGYKTKIVSTSTDGIEEVTYMKGEPEVEDDSTPVEDTPPSLRVIESSPSVRYSDDWDYEVELANRSKDVPYIIHRDEYFNNETPYEQITLTYYEGDDVLADSNDTPVDDQDAMVCLGNLGKFGHGSGDPNVVYVRNDELMLEIEIVHSDGKFATEVHGFSDDELRHSDRRHRPPRGFDDD